MPIGKKPRLRGSDTPPFHPILWTEYRDRPGVGGKMGFQRRLGDPGIPIQDIPPLDVILISHSHYDHLHLASCVN